MSVAVGALVEAAVIGPMRHQLGRTLLAILAIALGIALGLSIYLINRVAADEISLAARSLYGLADLAVTATNEDFDEALFPKIARVPGVAAVSPVLEIDAKLADRRGSLTIIGVDAFRYRELQPAFATTAADAEGMRLMSFEPNSLLLSASAARELGLESGEKLRVQVGMKLETFEIAGVLPPAILHERAALLDIAATQWKFDRLGRLSNVNLRLESGASPSEVRRKLQALAPSAIRVTTPGEATDDALRLSRAYRANLTALALVALFTGGFFVYSTQALSVLRRRRELAILHAMGLTRRQQLGSVLAGSALLGVLGAGIGIALGTLLARFGTQMLGAQIGAGYFSSASSGAAIRGSEIFVFCVLGILVALAGAARPALEAARIATASALKAGDVTAGDIRVRKLAIFLLVAASLAILFVPPISGLPLPGYISIALLLIATVAAMPVLIRWALRLLPRASAATYEIAIAELSGTARYAALSVSAIVVSFSLMVAMAIMVSSFRMSLDAWTQKILPADLYVRVGSVEQTAHLDERTAERLRTLAGVERIESSRHAHATLDPARPPLVVSARSFNQDEIDDFLWIMERTNESAPADAIPVWMSEAAADLFALRPGQTVALRVRGVEFRGFIQGIWRDYEHQNGAVIMPRDEYIRLTDDRAINTVWMWLEVGISPHALRERVRAVLPENTAFDVRAPGELRKMSLQVFDRTFAITYVLELVAVAIGLFGIASGISAQVLARRGELGALRHLGFTRGQIGSMLAIEGSVLGALGVLIGLANGLIVSLILIYVVNRQSFHWSMDLHAPAGLLTILSFILIACAALIAVLSGRHAMTTDVVRAVKEDW